jgi:DNA-directed RNA polymerase subunit beta'
VAIESKDGVELESYELMPGATLSKTDGEWVEVGERFVEWDPYNVPIITKMAGKVGYRDLIEGTTMKHEISGTSGKEEVIVQEHSDDVHPTLVILPEDATDSVDSDQVIDTYSLPANAHIVVEEGQIVQAGEILAKSPRQSTRTKDITGGLPRVAELFEARRPKEAAEIAKIDGVVELDKPVKGRRNIRIRDLENGKYEDHLIPAGKRIVVFNGDFITKGAPLTDGGVVLSDMLEICGEHELQEFLVNEVQQVYRVQGVEINDKHIEIIVRQMMRKVRITDPGQTRFLFGEIVDKRERDEENARVIAEGGEPARAASILLGITKASLATESFISAASFQDTTRVLTEAATFGRIDYLRGFKENVIMGNLIPAGTGYYTVQNVKLTFNAPQEEAAEAAGSQVSAEEENARKQLDDLRGFLDV